MAKPSLISSTFLLSVLIHNLHIAGSESFIGVHYGQVADNLPAPQATANLLQSTSIGKLRLYGADPAIIKALANTGIDIVLGTSNGDVAALANYPNFAMQWINSNVLPFYPASNIIIINVGNQILTSGDQGLIRQTVPAMRNLQNAVNAVSLGGKIKISTVHAMDVLVNSYPPSSGSFDPAFGDTMNDLLGFLHGTGSPFMVNVYPFFAYQGDPVDAVRAALNAKGYSDMEIVVAETGWPYTGDSDEVGPSVENAKAYNGGLIAHLRSMVGTPLMPGKSVDTYLSALYDENLKPGRGSERALGLFKPDLSMVYDVGLSKSTQNPTNPTPTKPSPKTPGPTSKPKQNRWCVHKPATPDVNLQESIDYVCGLGYDCSPIQPGGTCYEPNTIVSHAAYAMNLYYQSTNRNGQSCDFSHTATLANTDPSYGGCLYPDGST